MRPTRATTFAAIYTLLQEAILRSLAQRNQLLKFYALHAAESDALARDVRFSYTRAPAVFDGSIDRFWLRFCNI